MSDQEIQQRRFTRERAARKAAEKLLEDKSRELYAANQRLQELAERTHAIVESAAEGIVTYQPDGSVLSLNRSARQLFEYESTDCLQVADLFPFESEREALFPVFDDEASSQSPAEPIRIAGVKRSGERFMAEIAISCLTAGETPLYTILVRDLTRRRQIEAQLQQARKMESVGSMAAGIAHEINTPIQYIGNNIEFLQGAFDDLSVLLDLFAQLVEAVKLGSPPPGLIEEIDTQAELADLAFLRKEFPGSIEDSLEGIGRVADIVRSMKAFAQPAAEAKAAVDVNKAIDNSVNVSGGLTRHISAIELDLDFSVQPVWAIESQLNQVIVHVLANAVEAIGSTANPSEGKVRIETTQLPDCVQIAIKDNGLGIPLENQERVFDPFFTTKEVGQGTGQGLAFVYDTIVRKHGGSVRIESTPGEGTTLLLTLPHVRSPQNTVRQIHAHSLT